MCVLVQGHSTHLLHAIQQQKHIQSDTIGKLLLLREKNIYTLNLCIEWILWALIEASLYKLH